jgi:hypothetical protein
VCSTCVVMHLDRCIRHASIGFGLIVSGCMEPEPAETKPRSCLDHEEIVSDVPDFPIAYTTEHLDVHISDDRFLCAGSVIDYERHVQYVAAQLGIQIQRRMPVYAMSNPGDYCPGASACITADGVVFATEPSVYHELAHGVACEIRTSTPTILTEGLAVSFDPEPNDQIGTPQEFADIHRGNFSYYYSYAGHFVRWLASELGPADFAELYRTASWADGVWPDLEAAYGPTLASDYATQAPFMWVPHRQCADMPLLEPEANGGWVFEARFDCDDESTLGPYEKTNWYTAGSSTDMYQSFLIDIPEPGLYRLERSDGAWVDYERCLDEHPMTEQEAYDEYVSGVVFFAIFEDYGLEKFEFPGLWRIDVTHEHGPPVDVWITITPEPP